MSEDKRQKSERDPLEIKRGGVGGGGTGGGGRKYSLPVTYPPLNTSHSKEE